VEKNYNSTMRARRILPLLLVASFLAVAPAEAKRRSVASGRIPPPPPDAFSAAEPAAVRSTHLALDLDVDFETRQLRGSVTHTIVNRGGTDRFVVDTRDLEIVAVHADGTAAVWSLGDETRNGRALAITIPPGTRKVRIDYATSPNSEALYWLDPLQTTGGVAPFLFTFTQPDRTREWIPLQDTPGVRTTYEATLRVPPGLLAVMSALNVTEPAADGVYHITMSRPMPSYLIALAVGRLEFHPLDERTGFYSEPEHAADALWDLQHLPEMLEVAEGILGPYPFERYDVLLAPSAFYAGGMENPMLNFLAWRGVAPGNGESPPSPTEVLAHEMAHSWAGDAVTCATWSDTWLNEGFATYYSKRILEEMVSFERGEIGYYWDRQNYEGYVTQVARSPHLLALHRQYKANEGPSVSSPTNYNKGSIFLLTLEHRLGRETFDAIMRNWFETYSWRWVDELAFLAHLARWDVDADALQLEEWIYGTSLPANATAPQRSALWDRIGVEAGRFRSGQSAASLNHANWSLFDLDLFLWQISDVIRPRMAELDAAFGLSQMKSPGLDWLLAMAGTRYDPGMPSFEQYLLAGGPNVVFLYQEMVKTTAGRAYALQIYETARPRYDDGTREHVDRILGLINSSLPYAA
jgi:hypothetical protein